MAGVDCSRFDPVDPTRPTGVAGLAAAARIERGAVQFDAALGQPDHAGGAGLQAGAVAKRSSQVIIYLYGSFIQGSRPLRRSTLRR